MSSFDENENLDGLAWESTSDVNRLLEILKGSHPEKNKAQWKRVFDVVYYEYQGGVTKGTYPVYAPFTMQAVTTENAISKKTNVDATTVQNFMRTLHAAATSQQIAMVALNPGVGGKLKENIVVETADAAADAAKAAAKAAAEATAAALKGMWPLVLAAVAVVGFIYLPKRK